MIFYNEHVQVASEARTGFFCGISITLLGLYMFTFVEGKALVSPGGHDKDLSAQDRKEQQQQQEKLLCEVVKSEADGANDKRAPPHTSL